MTAQFFTIAPSAIRANPFNLIGRDWMLITAGSTASFNTMTASWGGLGHLWNRDVCFCFVRPQRYTYGFMEQASNFTLSFYSEAHRSALDYCGSHSGRDVDKVAATGLTPLADETGAVYFAQARLVLVCHKLYGGDIIPAAFTDPVLPAEIYAKGDFHRMYVGEIVRCLAREE